VTYQNIQ